MKKTLEDVRSKLEHEAETAKALTEAMILIHTGSYSFEQYEVTFETVQSFFGLMARISEKHANALDMLNDDITDICSEAK